MILKKFFLLFLVMQYVVFAELRAQTKEPYYYENISSKDSTLNFLFGFNVSTVNYYESKDYLPYTSINAIVINNSPKKDLKWNGYKVEILLKSGKLISNYIPDSKGEQYVCNYTVKMDSTHNQFYCFHTKFTGVDIDKVWLAMSADEIFQLIYNKNE